MAWDLTILLGNTVTATFGGPIGGSGNTHNVGFNGNGTLVLDGANTFGGEMRIVNQGVLVLNDVDALGSVSEVVVTSSATLQVNDVGGSAIRDTATLDVRINGTVVLDQDETIGGLTGEGTVRAQDLDTSGAATVTLTVGGGDADASFDGLLEDGDQTLALVKTGAGTQTLTGANTYTGGTAVDAGTLLANNTTVSATIIKGWLTERSLEITSNAIQIHGGMGFIEETGIAQHYRDARILPIYEGTTAIQANDLVFRKTLRDNGKAITDLISEINSEVIEISKSDNINLQNICQRMSASIDITKKVINHIVSISNNKKRSAVSGVNYLMMLGYVFGGWMMIKTASKSVDLKNKNEMDEEFFNAKISSSMIYFSSVLPKIESLSSIILQGDEDILAMKKNWL